VHWLLTLVRADGRSLCSTDLEHALFLDRFQRLARRWRVDVRAFVLAGPQARILVAGVPDAVGHLCRLQQSGWGVWQHHQGEFLCWEPSVRERVGSTLRALQVADDLHRLAGLSWPWSSLREATGLRHAGWVDARWFWDRRSPQACLEAFGADRNLLRGPPGSWRSPEPLPWALIEGALLHATGVDPRLRRCRNLRTRLAWTAGWGVHDIAGQLEIQPRAVGRTLRRSADPAWARARVLLHDPRLLPPWLLYAGDRATAAGPEVPCPTSLPFWCAHVG
jgi:hypothetical protein